MNLLALDTSGPVAGVALLMDGIIRYEGVAENKMTHSENLMPMIDEALLRAGAALDALTHIAVVTGPGSFTGVRIGVTAAKGMAHALGIPCVAVDALEATAAGLSEAKGVVCPLQDARVGQVYGAAFRGGKRLMADCVLKLPEFIEGIRPLGDEFLFTGDGARAYREQLISLLGEKARFAPAHCLYLRPAAAAFIGARDIGQAVDYLSLAPLYLRAPQAERERAAKEQAKA